MENNSIAIIDKRNLLYRMYFGVKNKVDSNGTPTQCIYGFTNQIIDMYIKGKTNVLIVANDTPSGGRNIRKEMYPLYKANREAGMPEDMKRQEKIIDEMLDLIGVHIFTNDGYEADDVIGSLANILKNDEKNTIYVLSPDKDLLQFIDSNVHIYDGINKKLYTHLNVHEKFGIGKEYIVDYLSLVGDTSDNIPGVKGIGPVSAMNLINTFGTVEEIYANIDKISLKERQFLNTSKENAFLSKKLALIETGLDIKTSHIFSYDFSQRELFTPEFNQFLELHGFHNLIAKGKLKNIKFEY